MGDVLIPCFSDAEHKTGWKNSSNSFCDASNNTITKNSNQKSLS